MLGPLYPQAISKLMAYMSLIIQCSQDYEGLSWIHYDMSFCHQAAASGNRNWSEVNSTLYSICFTGKSRRNSQCELCLAKSYATSNCPLQRGNMERQPAMPPQRGTLFRNMGGYTYHHQVRCANCGTTMQPVQSVTMQTYTCACVMEEITR